MKRKLVVFILDGCADYKIESLGGQTPLEAAKIPHLDRLVREGQSGLCHTTPEGMYTGSDDCCMGILGYNQHQYYTGRGPIEAAAVGLELSEGDVCFRCNTVNIQNGVMRDFTAGHISTKESRQLIIALDEELGSDDLRFIPGVSYRHLMVLRGRGASMKCTPPHDITDQPIAGYLPKDHDDEDYIRKIMDLARPILAESAVNEHRIEAGEKPATDIWLWGQGTALSLPSYKKQFGLSGAMITAVDLLRGLANLAGLDNIHVPGATGFVDTDYAAKGRYGIEALEKYDYVCIHIEAPDESGHMGNAQFKKESLEQIDAKIIGPVMEHLQKNYSDYRVLAMPDHYTPCALKTHSSEPAPFVIYGTGVKSNGGTAFTEIGVQTKHVLRHGWELMPVMMM